MSKWQYGEEFNPENYFGFVYKITNLTNGKFYIGKKFFWYNKKKKLTKKQLAEQTGPGRKSTFEIVKVESDWKTYFGSAKPVQALIKEGKQDEFKREILKIVNNKKLLTYYECKYLFIMGVLEYPESYFNDNILGKFFTRDFGVANED